MQTAALAASWEYRWVQVSTRRGEKTEAISRYGLLVSSNREEVICSGSSSSTSESYLLIQAHQQGQQSTSSKAAVLLAPQCSHIPTRRNQQDCHAFSCGEKTFTKERLGHTLRSRTRFTIESQILKCCLGCSSKWIFGYLFHLWFFFSSCCHFIRNFVITVLSLRQIWWLNYQKMTILFVPPMLGLLSCFGQWCAFIWLASLSLSFPIGTKKDTKCHKEERDCKSRWALMRWLVFINVGTRTTMRIIRDQLCPSLEGRAVQVSISLQTHEKKLKWHLLIHCKQNADIATMTPTFGLLLWRPDCHFQYRCLVFLKLDDRSMGVDLTEKPGILSCTLVYHLLYLKWGYNLQRKHQDLFNKMWTWQSRP